MVGPQVGNTNGLSNPIPGHTNDRVTRSFILWLGWFGFNAGSQLAISGDSANAVTGIIITTNIAAAAETLAHVCNMVHYGKPDISMTLNGVLAGLVGVTAGCAAVKPSWSSVYWTNMRYRGCICNEFIDKKLKVDDPVGAVSVHGVCGALGTLLVVFCN
jgi:Amt family ammonium transporter